MIDSGWVSSSLGRADMDATTASAWRKLSEEAHATPHISTTTTTWMPNVSKTLDLERISTITTSAKSTRGTP